MFFACLVFLDPVAWAGDDWLPVSREELKMTNEPKASGAAAIYLYRQVDRNDVTYYESNYFRIKILTEEGRNQANIEIPFFKDYGNIRNIEARSINPDGTIINFNGQIYDKTIVKARGYKYLAKTLTLPNVQVGGIIEYRYLRALPKYPSNSRWLLSEDLFTRHAKFSFRSSGFYAVHWSWPRGLPPGAKQPAEDHGIIRMEVDDIPAFQIEDYMPPSDEMKYRVEFTYTYQVPKDPDKFWKEEAKQVEVTLNRFVNKKKGMEHAVAEIISPSDSSEQKLQKIYARCQKIRNTSFEPEKTQQEQNRDKLKEAESVENVWKLGYGDGWDVSWLFLGLVRAAGFDANPVLVSTRDKHFFFSPKLMNPYDLNTNLVTVKLDGKDLYFDPGTVFTPFGVLPWNETGVTGLRIDKEGGTWVKIPLSDPAASGIERNAVLQLDESGSLEGTVRVVYKGLPALSWRIDERNADETARKKSLEDEIKASIPRPSVVELSNTPDWSSSSNNLVAEFHVSVPDWASSAGHRLLLPAAIFGGNERHLFEATTRVHPIAFEYPYIDTNDVSITLPSRWTIASLPQTEPLDLKNFVYTLTAENKQGTIQLRRKIFWNLILVDPANYGILHDFFQKVRTGDEEQVVLSPNTK